MWQKFETQQPEERGKSSALHQANKLSISSDNQPLPQGAFRSLVLRPEKSALGTRLVGGSFSFRLPHARIVYGQLSRRLGALLRSWFSWEILCSAKYL